MLDPILAIAAGACATEDVKLAAHAVLCLPAFVRLFRLPSEISTHDQPRRSAI